MCKSNKKTKTNEDRMIRIQQLCLDNVGSVRSVSLKLKGKSWRCVLKMEKGQHFDEIAVTDMTAEAACKGLKKRIKKIINRYGAV